MVRVREEDLAYERPERRPDERPLRRPRPPVPITRPNPHDPERRPEPSPTELLAFEEEMGAHSSLKEVLILDRLGVRPARYYQLLSRAVHDPAAVAAHPTTARLARDRFERKTR